MANSLGASEFLENNMSDGTIFYFCLGAKDKLESQQKIDRPKYKMQ